MSEQLFSRIRKCVCCSVQVAERSREPNRPHMVGISLVLYRRASGKKQLAGAGRVQICERCLALAISNQGRLPGKEARQLLASLAGLISQRYTLMAADDNAPAELVKPERQMFRELFREAQ